MVEGFKKGKFTVGEQFYTGNNCLQTLFLCIPAVKAPHLGMPEVPLDHGLEYKKNKTRERGRAEGRP